jgi:hypothetical protein
MLEPNQHTDCQPPGKSGLEHQDEGAVPEKFERADYCPDEYDPA